MERANFKKSILAKRLDRKIRRTAKNDAVLQIAGVNSTGAVREHHITRNAGFTQKAAAGEHMKISVYLRIDVPVVADVAVLRKEQRGSARKSTSPNHRAQRMVAGPQLGKLDFVIEICATDCAEQPTNTISGTLLCALCARRRTGLPPSEKYLLRVRVEMRASDSYAGGIAIANSRSDSPTERSCRSRKSSTSCLPGENCRFKFKASSPFRSQWTLPRHANTDTALYDFPKACLNCGWRECN
jgi:hypothetical protein